MAQAIVILIILCSFSACSWQPHTSSYADQYRHLHCPIPESMSVSPYMLIILVDARHLDYSDGQALMRTIVKHPSDGSKNSDVGHAWVYLQGHLDGKFLAIEGGHSGELGIDQPKYFEGVMDDVERDELNPIKYLWDIQRDGFFQRGSGGHSPTFAAKVDLSEDRFREILDFIDRYDFSQFSLVGNQCTSFAAQVAELAGLSLSIEVTIPIQQHIRVGGEWITLWEDPAYSVIGMPSPDRLEKSLMEAVQNRQAEYALGWYKAHVMDKSFLSKMKALSESIGRFPSRYKRVLLFSELDCPLQRP